ncbi:MAG: DUF6531 domain-containing protein, partial [Gammaproteobacteria bacterium]|nr:DUF6531 domain-containing protein [Gammaproteobacteria bacterium]
AVWAVGNAGTILFYDGSTWSEVASGVTANLNAVYGYGPDEVYAVGAGPTMLRFDGTSWAPFAGPAEATTAFVDVWTAGTGSPLYLLSARRAWYWDGSTWIVRSFSGFLNASLTPNASMNGLGGTATATIVASRPTIGTDQVSGGLFANFDHIGEYDTRGVYAASNSDIFAVGRNSYRFQGDNVRNRGQWRPITVMREAWDAWGTSPSNVYAVGIGVLATGGQISHYDGNDQNLWTKVFELPASRLNAIWGASEANIFAVGTRGAIVRAFDPPAQPTTAANFRYSGMATGYVNAFTGELVHSEVDLAVGHLMPITFERYYASELQANTRSSSPLGRNWTHNFEWRLITREQNGVRSATVVSPRGRLVDFTENGGIWQQASLLERPYTLLEINGAFTFADPDSELIYRFSNGQLATIEDRNGNRIFLNYVQGVLISVDDRKGNEIVLEYSNSNVLGRTYTIGGSTSEISVEYNYTDGNLSSVRDPMGRLTNYSYAAGRETDALLESISLPSLSNRSWSWDAERRVVIESIIGGGDIGIGYNGLETDVSTPDGVTRRYTHNADGTLQSFGNGDGGTTAFQYDSDGRRTQMTDNIGRITKWAYAPGSLKLSKLTRADNAEFDYSYEQHSSSFGIGFYDLVRIDKPDSSYVTASYDNFGNRLTFVDEALNTWTWTYDPQGQVATETNPKGGETTFLYWSYGALQDVIDHFSNTTRFYYDSYRRLTTIELPDQSRRLFELNDRGDITKLTTELGESYEYSYDGNGLVSQVMASSGEYVRMQRDAQGRVTQVVRPGENGEAFTDASYDELGRLASITRPGESAMELGYNRIGQLETLVDAAAETWTMTRDAEDTLKSIDPPGEDVVSFDNSSNAQKINTRASAGNESVELGLDTMNRIISAMNALEQVTGFERDERGLVTAVTSPEPEPGVVVKIGYEYDELGNLTKMTDAEGGAWENRRDEMGRVTSIVDPLNKVTQVEYGVGNRPDKLVFPDAAGSVDLVTNAAGQLTRRNYSDGTSIELDYDTQGRPVSGTNLYINHDTRGNLDDSNGVRITYDDQDRIKRITMANGRYIDYFYERGYLKRIVDWLGGETIIERNARGQATSFALPNGLSNGYAYDRAGRVIIVDFGTIGYISLQRRWDGNIERATRELPGPKAVDNVERRFDFDRARVRTFQYDALGNLLQDDATRYEYNMASQLMAIDDSPRRVTMEWDALYRPTAVTRENTESTENTRTELVWNYALSDERIAVERENGIDSWYYVYTTSGRLLYRINGDGIRHYYHFDEDGNTVFITDNAGQVIQTYFYSPLGEVLDSSGNVDNAYKKHAQQGAKDLSGDGVIYQKGTTGLAKSGVSVNGAPVAVTGGQPPTKNVNNEAPQDESPANDRKRAMTTPGQDLVIGFAGSFYSLGEKFIEHMSTQVRLNADSAYRHLAASSWGGPGAYLFKLMGGLTAGLSGIAAWQNESVNADGLYLTNAGRTLGSGAVGLVNGAYGAHYGVGTVLFLANLADYAAENGLGFKLGAANVFANRVGKTVGSLADVAYMYIYSSPERRRIEVNKALRHHGRHVLEKEGVLPELVGYIGGELVGDQLATLYNIASGENLRELSLRAQAGYIKVERALESWLAPLLGSGGN